MNLFTIPLYKTKINSKLNITYYTFRLKFVWQDLWLGLFIDNPCPSILRIYICPVPCFLIVFMKMRVNYPLG